MSDQALEQRVGALQAQGRGGGGSTADRDPTLQSFLAGAMTAYAASQQPGQGGQGLAGGGAVEQGLFGWKPTRYDSIFWCRSRAMCNPQSISCLC